LYSLIIYPLVYLYDQYDAVGWAPKEYNTDDKPNSNSDSQKDDSASQSGFVWDEKSDYYFDSSSGFYYDGNTGKYANMLLLT
jgi:RNA-binding protein 5/10